MTRKQESKFRSYQDRVTAWMRRAFSPEIINDPKQRCQRFLEEAIELVQSTGCMDDVECRQLVDYVYGRDVGKTYQEIGGVMVTLAAFCATFGHGMMACGETELERIIVKIDEIRNKQAAKPVEVSHDPRMSMTLKDMRSFSGPQAETIPPLRSSKA